MRTVCKPGHPVPYSLHDMRVSDITLSDGQLTLPFETGLIRIAEPCVQVDGRVVLTGVESCEVSRKHPEFSFEVTDELYGFNQVRYEGYLSLPDREKLTEFCMAVYYTGDLIYETEE